MMRGSLNFERRECRVSFDRRIDGQATSQNPVEEGSSKMVLIEKSGEMLRTWCKLLRHTAPSIESDSQHSGMNKIASIVPLWTHKRVP